MKDLDKVEDLHWRAQDDNPYIGMLWKNWKTVRHFCQTLLKELMYDWKNTIVEGHLKEKKIEERPLRNCAH